ncbi:MAG TPA: hypothetical protein VI564_01675 [Candidatus Nanoarchaeia archaeon]|nr:hypothetical protein [Candidatus Nanoarchaeia archaeon]
MTKIIELKGLIIEAEDNNPNSSIDLPLLRRNQTIKIRLEDDFWQAIFLIDKKVTIKIKKDDLPNLKNIVTWLNKKEE